jgi:hypothetical protein
MTSKDSKIRSTRLVSIAMTEAEPKYARTKQVIVENVKRRSVFRRLEASVQGAVHHPADCSIANQGPTTEAIGSAVDAANGNREPAPETTAGEDGRESHGRVHDVTIDDDSMVESKGNEFSPGKGLNLSVANYVSQIGQNWERGVDAFMTIARLCAEASARLTIAERGELLKQLPFGDSAFSKFVQIGNDHRLNTPELRRLLPPHYTITYAITLLTDQELQDAIAAKVIYPDLRRSELQKWRNSHRELSTKGGFAPSPKEAATDSFLASPPIASTHDNAESGVVLSALSQQEIQDKFAVQDKLPLGPMTTEDAPHSTAIEEVAGALPAPNDGEIPAFLDRRPLSVEDQRAFDVIMASWVSHVQPLFNGASEVVRERFIAALRANASS